MYLLESDTGIDDPLAHTLLNDTIETIREHGGSNITVTLADLNEQLEAEAPGRLIGPWQNMVASVSFWHDWHNTCISIEEHLRSQCSNLAGYLVTESVPQQFSADWEGGKRRPGITQFGANGKPNHVSDAEFFANWQAHSVSSFDLHPLRWSYVRNAVVRPLTENAPAYRAIVSEHFHSMDDFCDDSRYFGSEEAVQLMMEEVAGFCDFENMFSLGMSEFQFK